MMMFISVQHLEVQCILPFKDHKTQILSGLVQWLKTLPPHTASTMLVSLFVQSHCCRFSYPTVPTNVSLNTPVTGTTNSGEVKYYNLPFHSSGITFRLDVFQGSVVAYASYTTDAPNLQRGYNWTVQNVTYDDVYFSPAPGGTVYIALQGSQNSNSFRVGAVAQNFTTTGNIKQSSLYVVVVTF